MALFEHAIRSADLRENPMARAERPPIFVHIEGVARNFRSDWQYLIAASRINSALSLVTLFSALAIVTKFTDLVNLGTAALYTLIASSITYLAALAIIKLRAPEFLQDFQDYKGYDDKKNSHRWILWEFYHNLGKLKHGLSLLPESIEKELSFESAKVDLEQCPVIPLRSGEDITGEVALSSGDGAKETYKMVAFKPINFGRDLVMAFTIEKDQVLTRYVLPIRECDPKCEAKCKELFWIIFSQAAKENALSRRIAWFLIQLSAAFFVVALFLAVFHSLTKGGTPAPSVFHYV
jgi:hypothetical protein